MGKKGGLFRYSDGTDKLLMLFGTLGSIGDGLMSPLTMLVLSQAINQYGAAPADTNFSYEAVNKQGLRLFMVAIGVGISAFLEGICWSRTAERQTSRIRVEYLKSVLRQEVGFLDNQDSSSTTFQVVNTISSDAHLIQDVIAEKIPNSVAHFSAFMFSLVVAFILSWRLALAAFPFSLMFVVPGLVFGKILMKLGVQVKESYSVAGGIAEQAVSCIRTVYSYVEEQQTVVRFSHALEKSMGLGVKQGLVKGVLIGSMGMVFASWAFNAWVGSVLVAEKGEKGGAVFVAGICIIMGGLSIMSALPNISFIGDALGAANRIFEMIDRTPMINSEVQKGKTLPFVRGDLEFRQVEFNYPSRPDNPVLQGFNLKVLAGTTVGLVGGSGSGKSTVVSLLERFYDPIGGQILLDGWKLKKLQLKWLRSQMGLVSQEPILFATSIKENILFGKEGATMDCVVDAAKAANAHDFIMKLPDGYDTQAGQLGAQLSGGQKQRIAIARALIRDPKILLLDEATSALDTESERIVQEALDKASVGRTTIIVAHRLSTIRNANLIAVLQFGKVVESGSHDELIGKGEEGVYSKMVHLQLTSDAPEPSYCSPSPKPRLPQSSPLRSTNIGLFSPIYSPVFSISLASFDDLDDDDDDISDHRRSGSLQWRLLKMSAPDWKRCIVGCLAAVGNGSIQPVHAYCLGTVVSIYFLEDGSSIKARTRPYCFIFLGLSVLSFVANVTQHYNFAIIGERLTKRVREQLLDKVLTFEVGWFDRDENNSAAVCTRLAAEATMVRSLVADRTSLFVQVFCSAILAFTLGLIVTWRVAIVMIAMQPMLIGSFYSRSVLMKTMSARARTAQITGSQLASEATVNHRTITAFSSQLRIVTLYRETLRGPKRENVKQSWLSGFGLCGSQFLTTAAIALTYWYGGRLLIEKTVTPKRLFQAFFLLMSTGKYIADAGSMSSDIAKGTAAVTSVFEILDRETEIGPNESNDSVLSIEGRIEVKNVFFTYPARPDQVILKGLSLTVEAGKRVALVGQSGSGKSTIIALVERFYDPTSGSVLIDGRDIRSYELRVLRSCIALVSQEPTLFAGTLRENIAYGKDQATEAEIRRAAKLANAHEFISSMKDGYDTYCGERGVQLSGGQKQRIAIARAILKNPTILLLDEATSALDSVSENLIQEALDKIMVGRTCVVVAHRLSTVQTSDSIAVLKDGKVVEQGSHNELIGIGPKGSYYSLSRPQRAT